MLDGDLLKRTIELKRRLTDLTSRENKIVYYEDGDDDCSDDSDMEEVPPSTADDLLLARCVATTTAESIDNQVMPITVNTFRVTRRRTS